MKPVVLIPGIGGSILVKQGQQNRLLLGKYILDNRWINLGMISTSRYHDRWKADMARIEYIHNEESEGVIRMKTDPSLSVYDYGGTKGIKNLLPELDSLPGFYNNRLNEIFTHKYYGPICDLLYTKGYKDHVTLFGAPYDFRTVMDPVELQLYFARLTCIFERVTEPAVVMTHSFGGVLMKMFLGTMDQEWIDKHIAHWVCVSTPFQGSLTALLCAMKGSHYIPLMKSLVREEILKVSSICACIPNEGHKPLIRLKNGKLLHVSDYSTYAATIPAIKVYNSLMRPNLHKVKKRIRVPTTFLYNYTTPTDNFYDEMSDKYYKTAGDGMVPIDSLQAFKDIFDTSVIDERKFRYSGHTAILTSNECMDVLLRHTSG